MIEKYDSVAADVTHDQIVKDGFGPEAHADKVESIEASDPTANTRMVV
jgi:hypothetical protein